MESNYKIVLINNGEYLRKESANALLKVLEEPPEFAKVLITTNNENQIINTITSRCQVINLDDNFDKTEEVGILMEEELMIILKNTIKRELLELNRSKKFLNENKEDASKIYSYFYRFFHDLFIYNNTNIENNLYFRKNVEIYKNIYFFNNEDLINIMEKINEIKDLFKVNINFQIANEELLLYIMEEQHGRSSRNSI